jgi:hypothetical protein
MYGVFDFSRNPKEMFAMHRANWAYYTFIYIMVYILPMVIILASRFFWLCWKYRIPFFYFFGVNSIHLVYWSWYTTNEMVNTIGHELLHVTAHICEAYDIDMNSEQAYYIMGELCGKVFNSVK